MFKEYRDDGIEGDDPTDDDNEPKKAMICWDYVLWTLFKNNLLIVLAVFFIWNSLISLLIQYLISIVKFDFKSTPIRLGALLTIGG